MIVRSEIERNLKLLARRFVKAQSARDSLYASKLAILELGGWVEVSMDDVIKRCAKRHLKVEKNVKYCDGEIIRKTYGFEYDKHFRAMMIRLVGLVSVERIEALADPVKHIAFVNSLTAMKSARDPEAHTYIKGTARSIDAPSVTLAHFSNIYEGLTDIDRVIKSRSWS